MVFPFPQLILMILSTLWENFKILCLFLPEKQYQPIFNMLFVDFYGDFDYN